MDIIIAVTHSGISSLQKYDFDRYKKSTKKLSDVIEEISKSANQTYIDLNMTVLSFGSIESAITTYKKIRSACIDQAIALSSVMSIGKFDINVRKSQNKIHITHGEDSHRLRQGLRLFKGIGIRLPDSFQEIAPEKSSEYIQSVFLPIAGLHNLVEYIDLRYDSEPANCLTMFLKYIESSKGTDNLHSRYYIPLLVNLIRGLDDNEFDPDGSESNHFINEFISITKKPSLYRRSLGYGVILAVIVDRITIAENDEDRLKARLRNLFSTKQARKAINPYSHDNRVLSHKALSALVKYDLLL